MTGFVFILCAAFGTPALAGSVTLETDGAVEVQIGGVTIARALAAGTLNIGELPGGDVTMRLIREGREPMDTQVQVPTQGSTTMTLAGDTLSIQGTIQSMQPLAQPIVILRPAKDQAFTIIIDEETRIPFDAETVLDELSPGLHQIEFRSKDQLVVWVRGTLQLQLGDTVALNIEEGRMVTAEGTKDAWQAKAGR